MVFEEREVSSSKEVDEGDTNEEHTREIGICNIRVQTPHGKILRISHIACTENLSTVKMTLQDLLESCMLTQFNFALSFDVSDKATEESTSKDNKSNSITTYNEYTEIGTVLADYLSSPLYTATSEISLEVSELSLKIVYSQYDLKSARTHVKRVRDLLANPPALLGGDNSDSRLTLPSDMTDAIPVSEEMAAPDTAEDESLFVPYPPIDFFVQSSESKLQDFYEETLYKLGQRTVSDGGASSTLVTYASAITVSDFNPPPGPRKMQGDILYLMATFSEGTFHITCCTNGFYVNRTQGDQFDARPTTKHYGSHDLLDVLLCVSPSLKTQWEKHIHSVIKTKNNRKPVFRQTSPLQAIAEHYRSGRSDDICPSQWNIPGLYTTQTVPKTHTRDSWRTQTSLLDAFGMEEKGPPRDWNDEVQAIKEMPTVTVSDKITRMRLLYRCTQEYAESCVQLVRALAQGLIAPLNPMEPTETHVYVYNNIFVSQAVDSKETFKLCSGDVATKKSAGHDIKNQKILQFMNVDGLSYILSLIIDYRGSRYMCQSIIPGVLVGSSQSGGSNHARLVYGLIDHNKRVSVKTQAFAIMQTIGKKLRIPTRNLPATPVIVSDEFIKERSPPVEDMAPVSPRDPDSVWRVNDGGEENLAAEGASSIRVDSEDEIAPADAIAIPHVGPIEAKLIEGSDGRLYCLEMMRLTPRDANYVAGGTTPSSDEVKPEGYSSVENQRGAGTGIISPESLAKAGDQLASTYVHRPELVPLYLQRQLMLKQREAVAQSPLVSLLDGSADPAETEGSEAKIRELEARISSIKVESIELDLNPNVFINHPERTQELIASDIDDAIIAKDENYVRTLSRFLYNEVLPSLVNEMRHGDVAILGGERLVEAVHARGINLRYLGRLAELAHLEEAQDSAMIAIGQQRVHTMPHHWLELLETEMIARSFRRLLNEFQETDLQVANAPAQTITSALNHIFGVYGATASLVATDSKDEEGPADIGGKAKKRKKSKSAKVTVGALDGFLVTPDAASSRTEFLNALDLRIAQRFLYSLTLVQRPKSDAESETGSYLDQRISRLPLLRRICMLCGLRIATREYDFQSPTPFTIDDIMALLPRIKESSSIEHTSDSEALVLPEASELLRTARRLADEGKFAQAVNAAQEAGGWLSDCVGMVHKDYRRVLNEIVSICMATGEYEQALPFAATNLTLSVQIDGLDSPEIVSQHIRLATVHLGLVSQLKETLAVLSVEIASGVEGDSGQHASPAQMEAMRTKLTVSQQATAECKRAAISHLLTAKYLIELIGGVQHPELVTIFLRLGTFLVDEDGQFQSGILCMISQVRQRLTDLVQYAQVTTLIAECFFKKGFLQQGVDYQRKIFKVMTDLFGVKDSRTVEAKTRLESYIRAVGQETSRQKTLKQQQLAKQVEHTIEHAQQGIEKKMENLTLIDKVGDNKAHSAIGTVKGQYLLDIESSEHSNAGGRKYHNYHHHAPHKKKHAPKKK